MKLSDIIHSLVKPRKTENFSNSEPQTEPVVTSIAFHKLSIEGNVYSFTNTVPYIKHHTLRAQTIELVFDFAYRMAFTDEGEHREYRSGGTRLRTRGEIFANAFQGKIAECAACNFFYQFGHTLTPDFAVHKRGIWDTVDLSVSGMEIAVKSTKGFGQLLLLETADWDEQGRYIPNKDKDVSLYDCLMLIRIKPSCEDILKKENKLYTNDILDRDYLHNLLARKTWEYNYAGYITYNDLCDVIRQKIIIPKGALLNGRMPMDAENYYVQAGDLRKMSTFEAVFPKLKRKGE